VPADAFFAGVASSLGLGSDDEGEPTLVVSGSQVAIETLDLNIQDSWFCALYNAALWLAENSIKEAVLGAVNSQLTGNVAEALKPLNDDERVKKGMKLLLDGLNRHVRRASTAVRRASAVAPPPH
jgi:hypothetical protein